MDLEQLRNEKKLLENRLTEVISIELEKFDSKTNWTAKDIHVCFIDLTSFGDERPQRKLNRAIQWRLGPPSI